MSDDGRCVKSTIERIRAKLPPTVRDSIYPLRDLGIPDLAWPLEQIDHVLLAIKDLDLVILGGDIYEDRDGRVRCTESYDNWHSDRRRDETFEDYARRSWQHALDYTIAYPRTPGRTQYVALVMTDDHSVGAREQSRSGGAARGSSRGGRRSRAVGTHIAMTETTHA